MRVVILLGILFAVGGLWGSRFFFLDHDPFELDRVVREIGEGNTASALDRLEGYLGRRPDDDRAWAIRGGALETLGRGSEAAESYREALRLNDENFQAVFGLADLSRQEGNLDQAARFYRRALELEPGYPQATAKLAAVELLRGNNAEALRLARLSYESDRENPVVVANLAVALHWNGRFDERDRMTERAVELGYPNADALKRIYSGDIPVRVD